MQWVWCSCHDIALMLYRIHLMIELNSNLEHNVLIELNLPKIKSYKIAQHICNRIALL